MRIRIQVLTLIRILSFNLMRIHEDPDPGPQHCILEQKRYEIFVKSAHLCEF
jgi:hypothetical protein